MQRYELKESQVSDDFMHWFKNGEHIYVDVFWGKNHSKCLSYTGECHIYIYLSNPMKTKNIGDHNKGSHGHIQVFH